MAFSKNLIDANSYFSTYKSDLERPRSRFDRSSSVKTSFNVGDLVPFYLDEVLPGDTFDVEISFVTRLQALITPPMDALSNFLFPTSHSIRCGQNRSNPQISKCYFLRAR